MFEQGVNPKYIDSLEILELFQITDDILTVAGRVCWRAG